MLTDYLWSIPGFEDYCTALGDTDLENKDSNDSVEGDDDTEVDVDSVEGDDDTEVDVDSVETFPDDRIQAWLQDQIEDWLDIYSGFQDACSQFHDVQDDGCSGEDGCSGDSCDHDEGWSREEVAGYSDGDSCDHDEGRSREEFDGYSDDGYDEDSRLYGYEEDAHH